MAGYGGAGYGGGDVGYGGGGAGFGGGDYGGGGGGGMGYGGGTGYGASQGGSQGYGGARQRQDALQSCTVKQVLEATGGESELSINGNVIQQVTLVARLNNVDTQVTVMKMQLDDGSGIIECNHMLPPDEDSNPDVSMHRRQLLRDGCWARIVGRIMISSGIRQIEAFMLRPLIDHNEITYHRLDVIRTFLAQTRPRKRAGADVMQGVINGGNSKSAIGSAGGQHIGGDGLNMDAVSRSVYEYAKQKHDNNRNSNEAGFSVDDVVRDVPHCGGHANAKNILDNLCSEGHIYTTTDDDHYAFCQV